MRSPHAVVIGGGLIGVSSAYVLSCAGWRVTLVEARGDIGLVTSFANGGLLTPSMSDPWNSPGVYRQLFNSIRDPQAAMKLRLASIPSLVGWGMSFLRNSVESRFLAATKANFVLARYSVNETRRLTSELDLRYDGLFNGTLKLFRDYTTMDASIRLARVLQPLGLRYLELGSNEVVTREPALRAIGGNVAGALYYPDDGWGDAWKFCHAVLDAYRKRGGNLCLESRVDRLVVRGGMVTKVITNKHALSADAVVVATGTSTSLLLRNLGVSLPIQPVKGYTLTIPFNGSGAPALPVVDDSLHAAVTPLPGALRVAGTAEFAGPNNQIKPERIDGLVALLKNIYPDLLSQLDLTSARPWTGLRPMSASGVPHIGATSIKRLYVNAGHGHLGWTMAVGSARLLCDIMNDRQTAVDPAPYAALRPS